MKNDVLEELDKLGETGIKKIYKQLLAFCQYSISSKAWGHGKQSTTKGREASDFVSSAIQKAIDGTRKWNKKKNPMLIDFLKGIIKSEINNAITSKENELTAKIDINSNGGYSFGTRDYQISDIDFKDEIKRYREVVLNLQDGDDDYIEFIFDEMLKGSSSKEISQDLGININEVYNYQRRIRNVLKKIRKNG